MIFGVVKLDSSASIQDQVLNNILTQLSWSDVRVKNFAYNSFSAYYLYDKRLPPPNFENIFYHDDKERVYILMDGTIYNENEIHELLDINNKKISSPKLILKAYNQWGITFADKFNGDFAITLYLEKLKQIIIISDHLGNRPIAFSSMDSLFYFGSDVIGLCKALFPNDKINKTYILNLFFKQAYDYTVLPNQRVEKLHPGHYLKFSSAKKEYKPYWKPFEIKTDRNLNFKKVSEDLRLLLSDAVSIRVNRNYTAATHISGGLDSGLISAMTRRLYPDQTIFYGFSWTPDLETDNQKYMKDERIIIKEFCRENKMIPVFTNYNEEDYRAFLSNWRHPSEFIYEGKTVETAKKNGIHLIFSGWGGDEFLSINNIGIDADLIRNFAWAKFLEKYPLRRFKKFIYALVFKGLFPSYKNSYLKNKAYPEIFPYIKQHIGNNIIPSRERYKYNSRKIFHLQFLKKYAHTARTSDWYVLGQRNGIEYRYPLLDKRIVEYMLKVPSSSLVNGSMNRAIMRNIGKEYLSDKILYGNKADPVCNNQFEKVTSIVRKSLINELDAFRKNPYLNFVDFERLDNELAKFTNIQTPEKEGPDLTILHYLKKVHEFTKGYYSNSTNTPKAN